MSRKHPLSVAIALLALLGLGGIFNELTGLLMVAPFLLLITLLISGRYPGERVIARLGRALGQRREPRSPASLRLPAPVLLPLPGFLLVTSGTRGPPRIA